MKKKSVIFSKNINFTSFFNRNIFNLKIKAGGKPWRYKGYNDIAKIKAGYERIVKLYIVNIF